MKPTDFAGHLTKYLTVYLPAHQGAKSNTIHSYRDSFSLLIEYCRDRERIPPEKLSVSRVDKRLIIRFIDWLEKERGCSISTRNHRLASIRSFFAYLAVEAPEYLEQCQRIFSIPMKKAKKPPLKYLTLEHTKAILSQPDRTTFRGKRDAVLLSILYDTGARVQELIDMKYGDIALNDTVTITLTGKGGKSRIVPLMQPTGELLKQYIYNTGKSVAVNRNELLFPNKHGKKYTRAGITYILQKCVESARNQGLSDMPENVTPHWLRHSKAMHLLQAGVNLVYIRDLLGHADITTTEIYARADEKMKLEALTKAYNNPTDSELPSWKKDRDLLDWLKSL